jgi:hypothetical protein
MATDRLFSASDFPDATRQLTARARHGFIGLKQGEYARRVNAT